MNGLAMLATEREQLFSELADSVGNTRLVELTHLPVPNGNRIFAKAEFENPSGSLYDRIYTTLFHRAEESGIVVPGITPLIEASTGNAGAAFAKCCQLLGYHDYAVITHADTPGARVQQMESYGACVLFSPPGLAAKGYVQLLEQLLAEDKAKKGGRIGSNPQRLYCVTKISPSTHELYYPIVDEVFREVDRIDIFLGVVGSGGSLSGIGKRLKQANPETQVIAVDPIESPTTLTFLREQRVLEFNNFPHELWGASPFGVPLKKLNLDLSVVDGVMLVTSEEWRRGVMMLKGYEGLDVGRTSGAILSKALEVAQRTSGKNLLITLYDPGWKYEDLYPHWK
jgi:cysteine synthase A